MTVSQGASTSRPGRGDVKETGGRGCPRVTVCGKSTENGLEEQFTGAWGGALTRCQANLVNRGARLSPS
eukprot:1219262-Ditylum_brightwellii.AAC.1